MKTSGRNLVKWANKCAAFSLHPVLLLACGCGARSDLGGPIAASDSETTEGAGPTTACGQTSCTGCCSTSGQCLAGTAASACGSGGNACAVCPIGTCSGGVCKRGTVVLFGGSFGGSPPAGRDVYSNDTWTFDGTSWNQVLVSNLPSVRYDAVMATLGNGVVLFGGFNGTAAPGTGVTGPFLNDTWMFIGTSWTQVPVSNHPSARGDAMSATLGNKVVLFGGGEAPIGSRVNDTWTFDGTNWTQVSVSNPPPAREGAMTATLGNEVVLFGGIQVDATGRTIIMPLNDTWTFDGTNWTQVLASNPPPSRAGAAMATLGNEVVLFGGNHFNAFLNDTWMFDGTSWTQVPASNPPPSRAGAAMATLGNEVVLFGGANRDGKNDTWTFDGTSWTQVLVSNPPPSRASAAMATLP